MAATKIVRAQSKGMVTIPVEFREKLNINENSLLEAKLLGNGVMFVKVNYKPQDFEIYSDKQIKKWLKEDKLNEKTIKKLQNLLK